MARWVVVGGGASGCVVAARLSERTGDDVVLLEAGPRHGPPPLGADLGPFLSDPSRLEPTEVGRRPDAAPEPYLQGRGLGGSSLVNASVVTGDDPGGHDLPLEAPWASGPLATALLAADPEAHAVRLVRRGGQRATAADVYLTPAEDRENLTILTDTRVRSIRLAGRRAVGVELAGGGTIDAERVVMCAGAIRTPVVLLRSGVAVDGLGERLQDHPAFTITVSLREQALDPTAPSISAVADHDDHHLMPLEHLPGAPRAGALLVGLLRVGGEGRVTIGTDGRPLVELRQLTRHDDLDRLVQAVRHGLDLVTARAFSAVVERAFVDTVGTPVDHLLDHPDRVPQWVLDHLGGHYHVAGTCRDGSVCDGGVLRGYEGLYVADASALPGVPRRDPYLHVVCQAERFVAGW